jgi:hypothetical protein
MSNDLEERLRSALRPIDPGEEFTARVLARVAREGERGREIVNVTAHRRWRPRMHWISVALAASLVLAVVGVRMWHESSERAAGLEAREQLREALRVTSEKLDLAYESVNSEKHDDEKQGSGA